MRQKRTLYKIFSFLTFILFLFSLGSIIIKPLLTKKAEAVRQQTTVTLTIYPKNSLSQPKHKRIIFFPEKLFLQRIWEEIQNKINSLKLLF